jgi:putative oxidoreductase
MKKFLHCIFDPASENTLEKALCFMRVGIGILTMIHGIPKIMGGVDMWGGLGVTFMFPLGIDFMPVTWGFLAACTEFFGGISYILGLGTRISSAALSVMMFIATLWHLNRGDGYNLYSFPLSLLVVFIAFMFIGSGVCSMDNHIAMNIEEKPKF